jgi:hypothetical protein
MAMRNSDATDGITCPFSTWEMNPPVTLASSPSARTLSPRSSRRAAIRRPIVRRVVSSSSEGERTAVRGRGGVIGGEFSRGKRWPGDG